MLHNLINSYACMHALAVTILILLLVLLAVCYSPSPLTAVALGGRVPVALPLTTLGRGPTLSVLTDTGQG